jgi:hypothetical protein
MPFLYQSIKTNKNYLHPCENSRLTEDKRFDDIVRIKADNGYCQK